MAKSIAISKGKSKNKSIESNDLYKKSNGSTTSDKSI